MKSISRPVANSWQFTMQRSCCTATSLILTWDQSCCPSGPLEVRGRPGQSQNSAIRDRSGPKSVQDSCQSHPGPGLTIHAIPKTDMTRNGRGLGDLARGLQGCCTSVPSVTGDRTLRPRTRRSCAGRASEISMPQLLLLVHRAGSLLLAVTPVSLIPGGSAVLLGAIPNHGGGRPVLDGV
jgi:hypothetical protein